jgi:hypothetical protein
MIAALSIPALTHAQLADFFNFAAKDAKSKGLTTIGYRFSEIGDPAVSLSKKLDYTSQLIIVDQHKASAIHEEIASVYTWRLFRIEKVLREQPVSTTSGGCLGEPYSGRLAPGEIALQFGGGKVIHEGITIEFSTGWAYDDVNVDRYLAFVRRCSSTAGYLPDGPYGLAGLADDGRFILNKPAIAGKSELVGFGTLTNFLSWLQER